MALGKSSGFFSFYTSGGTGDSFYEEVESENRCGIPTKIIEVETLDNVIKKVYFATTRFTKVRLSRI
jgi:hypothetical protein